VDHRRTLEDIIDGREFLYVARRLADDGLKAWQQVQERGYEGLVAKDQRALPHRVGQSRNADLAVGSSLDRFRHRQPLA
jgi:ATP-dependent DNA ligase